MLEVFSDPELFVEEEGILLVTAERLGEVLFTPLLEDLNLEGTILFPCAAELKDVTDFCESGVNLLMAREEIPDFEVLSSVLLTRLDGLLITPEFFRLELDVRTEVFFTLETELIVFPEE